MWVVTVWYNALNEPDEKEVADINIQNYYELLHILKELG